MKEIPLTRGKVALVDDEDWPLVSQFHWVLKTKTHRKIMRFYAHTRIKDADGKHLRYELLHRLILGLPHGDKREGDHFNGNGLDNRRENIRIVTRAQNCWNTFVRRPNKTGIVGIRRRVRKTRFGERIRFVGSVMANGKLYCTPEVKTLALAARLRDELVLKHHGAFAITHFSHPR